MVTIRIGDREESLTWEEWEHRVRDGRVPGYTQVRFEPVTGADFVPADELDLFQSLRDDARQIWTDRYRAGQPPWMTALLAGVQIRLWWLVTTSGLESVVDRFTLWQPRVLEDGEVWRMLTMGFLHVSPGHIASNLVMLVYVGWNLERALGRLNLLTLYVGSVVGGSILSMALSPDNPSLGASGGVLGVVAGATVFGFIRQNLLPERARVIFGWALLPYLLLIYGMGWMNEGTDNWAHTGGLVSGALLALVLDPPGLERRRGWNLVAVTATWVGVVATLIACWAVGPGFLGLTPTHLRGPQALVSPPLEEPEVVWSAPPSWTPRPMGSDPGYGSRASTVRGVAVGTGVVTDQTLARDLGDRWIDDRTDAYGTPLRVERPTPDTLAGIDGVHTLVVVPGRDGPVHEERWIAVRGRQVLRVTWSVEAPLADRMAGLRDRIVDSVRWNAPKSLQNARAAFERAPRRAAVRTRLAEELLRVGAYDEAMGHLRALRDAEPRLPDRWTALLQACRRYPEAAPAEAALADARAALQASPDPVVAAEAARVFLEHGEREVGLGLLELVWAWAPGTYEVRAARQDVGLPVRLNAGRPAHLWHDPLTGAPRDAPRRVATAPPWSVQAARETGVSLRAEHAAFDARVRSLIDDPARLLPLLVLRERGALPDRPGRAATALAEAHDALRAAARGGRVQPWIPPSLVAAPLDEADLDPDRSRSLRSLADTLEGEPTVESLPSSFLETYGLTVLQGPRGPTLVRG